ncbi:2-oxoglutarate and iron-dependent oxygenase domain-containing protein [Niveibacterium sp. SC-1]|uniref:isopenicillin N synthase family dioxygenase n=1 Tax=Niveibacterium sp. SC-1 TaxID=3135646 RepID=UPI00311EC4E1
MNAVSPAATATIPLIDVAPLRGDDARAKRAVAAAIRAAAEDHGFFYIREHGIPESLIKRVFTQTEGFFAQPAAAKLALDKARSFCHRGYEPLRGQTLEKDAPPDLKEGFYIGPEASEEEGRQHPWGVGPNQWPADLPGFRSTMEAYRDAMHGLAAVVMRGLALSLDLPEDYFEDFVGRDPLLTLRLLHYPPQPPDPMPGEKGCGAHTDFGSITLLLQDENGGLQVRDAASGGWIDAPPIPGTYVVNLGDLIARWTNGRYHSTLHRVINVSGRERHSVPFFMTGRGDHLVRCLPTCLAPGEAEKYPPVTVAQHMLDCYRRTYA